LSRVRRSSKLIYSKWDCSIKNNKIINGDHLHFLFDKRGATQCGLSKGRWFGENRRSNKPKKYEIDTPLNRVLRAEGVSEEVKGGL
jgi:hypothetical protein